MSRRFLFQLCASAMMLAVPTGATAQQVGISSGSVVETVRGLKAGQYAWAPELAPEGPVLLVVNRATQRAILYRNGIPIGASTVSTGRPGYATPTGIFSILQKQVEHYSSTYDNAPMPYMQRLTWRGVALHAGTLPGYPASHGCIRLPAGFARLLYGATSLGMMVVVTDQPTTPRVAPTPEIALAGTGGDPAAAGEIVWKPDLSPTGPVTVIVSAADSRAVVIRNGVEIGSAPVTVEGPVTGTWAYSYRNADRDGQHWLRLSLSPQSGADDPVAREEWSRFQAPAAFRRDVAAVVRPGATVIVTADSLHPGAPPPPAVLIESDPASGRP